MQFLNEYLLQMKSLLGEAGFLKYEETRKGEAEHALRINLLRCPDGNCPFPIDGVDERVPWAREAYYLRSGARPGLSPFHEAGLYYLQEPSALSAVAVLNPMPGEVILDLCAAPGGKSTQIAGRMQGCGLLIANEPVPARARILSRNMERMGIVNSIVTHAYPEKLSPAFAGYFDAVLVDAPCSGEGMFRRVPESQDEWDPGAPQRCADRQKRILHEASLMVRHGGRMVYSTCTFNRTENEDVIEDFLKKHGDFELHPFELPGLSPSAGFEHLYPHEVRGEGHFVALLCRKGESERAGETVRGGHLDRTEVEIPERLRRRIVEREGKILCLPEEFPVSRLKGIPVLREGVVLFHLEGRHWEPDHALAMALKPQEGKRVAEVSEKQALRYQAGEELEVEGEPGYTLLTCQGIPLGWGKQSGGRMKNHYPKGLRRRQDSLVRDGE